MSEKLYWLIEGDEAKAKWAELSAKWDAILAETDRWVQSVKGESVLLDYGYRVRVVGIRFDIQPDNVWRRLQKHPDYHMPHKRTKAGKALFKQVSDLEWPQYTSDVGRVFLSHETILDGMRLCRPGFERIGDDVVIIAARPKPGHPIQWEPIAGLRKLKDSEYWQIKEAIGDHR